MPSSSTVRADGLEAVRDHQGAVEVAADLVARRTRGRCRTCRAAPARSRGRSRSRGRPGSTADMPAAAPGGRRRAGPPTAASISPTGNGLAEVAVDAVEVDRDVDADDVAVAEPQRPRDAVADHLVDGGADRPRVAEVAERARVAAAADDASWPIASSSSVVTPGRTCGSTSASTSEAASQARRMRAIVSGSLRTGRGARGAGRSGCERRRAAARCVGGRPSRAGPRDHVARRLAAAQHGRDVVRRRTGTAAGSTRPTPRRRAG